MHGRPIESIPEYDVSLREDASIRWDEIIWNHAKEAASLVDNALAVVNAKPGSGVIKNLLKIVYKLAGGLFQDDIEVWAKALDRSVSDIVTANLSYELAPFGCTSVVCRVPRLGLVHVRNLDWDVPEMGPNTIVVRFRRGRRDIVAVTCPGLVGILSGMVPGRFSVSLNWAPPTGWPRPTGFGPIFLVRHVLETARDFNDAVAYLNGTGLTSSAFFTVVGPAQACVIERTADNSEIRWLPEDDPLVVTNHYVHEDMIADGDDAEKAEDSLARYRSALRAARNFRGSKLSDALKVLSTRKTLHEKTVQQMAFSPATGRFVVRAFDNVST